MLFYVCSCSYVTSTFVIEAMAAANAYHRLEKRSKEGVKDHCDQPGFFSEKESPFDNSVPTQYSDEVSVLITLTDYYRGLNTISTVDHMWPINDLVFIWLTIVSYRNSQSIHQEYLLHRPSLTQIVEKNQKTRH